jgi:hypothetical protein
VNRATYVDSFVVIARRFLFSCLEMSYVITSYYDVVSIIMFTNHSYLKGC